jgi:fatty-acyl-CoA synthase
MRGYWNRPEETAEALRGGWLHTGDAGRFDEDGRLHIVDRLKDLIISGGFNIYPREVEDALAEIDGVQACAVVGVPDSKWGEAVAAAIVAAPGTNLSVESLISRVKGAKGPIHAPKQIIFVDSLPLTPIGKVDKKALRLLLGADHGG